MAAAYPPAEAVIFDMDGVLVDSEPFWRRVELEVFDGIGVDIRPVLGRGLTMGRRVDEVVAFFRSQFGFVVPSDEELVSRVVEGVVRAVQTEGELMPGALEALEFCGRHGLKRALASGSTAPVIDAVLERLGLADAFDAVCSAEDDDFGKPHPSVFLRTADELALDPTKCVVLEDSVNGCIAAKAARMRVIAVPDARHGSDGRFEIADLVIATLRAFPHDEVLEVLGLDSVARGRLLFG